MKNFIVSLIFISALSMTNHALAAWSIEFIPNEASSVSVLIDNQPFYVWQSSMGSQNIAVSPQWANNCKIHVYAAANPKGKNASIKVLWNGTNKQTMDFDDDEDHDVDCN